MHSTPNLPLFLGRLHPLIIHLPIGFLTALAVLEVVTRLQHFKNARQARGILLVLTALSAVAAAGAGLLLSTSGGYDPHLLAWHKYTGLSLAGVCVLACLFYLFRRPREYAAAFILALLLLVPAGHFGGSITHGRDYLTQYAPDFFHLNTDKTAHTAVAAGPSAATTKPASPAQVVVFTDLIQPILAHDCLSCHNAEKLKGGLRLDSLDHIRKGGDSGPAVVPGKSGDSLLAQRVQLPDDDDDHMPPAGKPQPTAEQIALLTWWIDAGAPADKTLAELAPSPAIADIAAKTLGMAVAAPAKPAPLADLAPQVTQLTADLGVVISRVAPDQPWLTCNASVARSFGDAQLARLAPLANNLVAVDLAFTKVTDAGMATVAKMPYLRRLRLERTKITDAGLRQLTGLRQLEYLNLYATQVSDAGLASLKQLPALRKLYLWQTKVDPTAARDFAQARSNSPKVEQLKKQIAALQSELDNQRLEVIDGLPTSAPSTAPTRASMAVCPLTGKPADPTKTVEFQGRTITFCCDKCLAEFKKDPARYKTRLSSAASD